MAAARERGTVLIPPLREIKLNSRPYAMRALDFSCDGELAVAADDSIHILVPEFPDPAYVAGEPEEEDDNDEETKWTQVIGRRAQYSQGGKQFVVSRPPVHPRVNEELFDAAGIPFPYGKTEAKGKSKAVVHDSEDSSDAAETDSQASSNTPFGAGFGTIVGSGSSMNHVIHLRWSPPGLGVNRRSVLAVMTSRGTLVMYGDRVATASLGMSKVSDGMLMRRNLDSWSILWGIGERLIVPGQQTETSEAIKGFAWAKEIGAGQGLVAYITDQKEVAIISVQAVPVAKKGINGKKEERYGNDDAWESDVVWKVHEVTRLTLKGPHLDPIRTDPNWTPFGTAYALAFSPWLRDESSRSCLLSYVDRSYIGFRKITLEMPWTLGQLPKVTVDKGDMKGECVYNSSDSFFEFEDAIWTMKSSKYGESKVCRGILNTGFHIKALEVAISGGPNHEVTPHKTDFCGTTYNNEKVNMPNANPIIDLVIHPPDLSKPTKMPIYTLVRGSATHTNDNWYETSVPMPDNPAAMRPQPRWATELRQKLGKTDTIDVLPGMFAKTAMDDESNDGDFQNEEDQEDATEDLPGKSLGAHDQRFRFYGLTASAGGGMSAVLVMPQATSGPDRDTWHNRRTSLLFDSKATPQRHRADAHAGENPQQAAVVGRPLTTEARMMEYMYGAGPEVSGVITSAAANQDRADGTARTRAALRELFREAVDKQTCDIDGGPLKLVDDGWECGLHVWGICGTSGLAIMVIGKARVCAVCGSRTLPLEMLARKLPEEKRAEMEALAAGDVCGRCGGKFLN